MKNFSTNIDLRYDVDNGITLCEECHLINYQDSFHSIYGEKDNTPEQIYEFIQFKKSNDNNLITKGSESDGKWQKNCV